MTPPPAASDEHDDSPHWRVVVQFRQQPPLPVEERLACAESIEGAMRPLAIGVAPRVMVLSDGLSVALHVQAPDRRGAESIAGQLLEQALSGAAVDAIGQAAATDIRPIWRPSPRRL